MAVLEDPHQRAERRGQRQDVAHQRLHRQHHAAGEQEQQHEGDGGHQPQHQRKPVRHRIDAVAVDLGDTGHLNGSAGRPGHLVQPLELGVGCLGKQRRRAADGQECAAVGQPGGRGRRSHPVSAHERPAGRRHRRHVGNPRQVGGVPVKIRRAQATGVGDDDGHRRRGIVREIGAQLVTDLMRRRRTRQHPVVRETPLHREERKPEQQQQRDDGQTDRRPAAHHELARPVPEQLLDGLVHRIGAAAAAGAPAGARPVRPAGDPAARSRPGLSRSTRSRRRPRWPHRRRRTISGSTSGTATVADIDNATVTAENSTVRPEVAMVRISASSRSLPSANSSR